MNDLNFDVENDGNWWIKILFNVVNIKGWIYIKNKRCINYEKSAWEGWGVLTTKYEILVKVRLETSTIQGELYTKV